MEGTANENPLSSKDRNVLTFSKIGIWTAIFPMRD